MHVYLCHPENKFPTVCKKNYQERFIVKNSAMFMILLNIRTTVIVTLIIA